MYEGISRPIEILRILDGPQSRGRKKESAMKNGNTDINSVRPFSTEERKIIEQYFQDLCIVFMKKISNFMVNTREEIQEDLTLQAMLQEMIKVKKLIGRSDSAQN